MPTNTPAAITDAVLRLCNKLSADAIGPLYVPVQSETEAVVEDCFVNVSHKVVRDGGEIVHGWQLWEWVDVMLEAEFHAVWRSPACPASTTLTGAGHPNCRRPPAGDLIDITPKRDGETAILFLPDMKRVWTGTYIDNIRMPLKKTPLFADLEFVCKRLLNLYNQSEKTAKGISMNPSEFAPLQEVKEILSTLLNSDGHLHSPCPCGSGLSYKKCHRRVLQP